MSRDAMQGIKDFIPTAQKVAYLNSLLKVGFNTLDFGSFVSPKAIPQMRDTANVSFSWTILTLGFWLLWPIKEELTRLVLLNALIF